MNLRENLIDDCTDSALYRESMEVLPPNLAGIVGRIASLALAPIKSLGMLEVSEACVRNFGLCTVAKDGLFVDRAAMLVEKSPGKIGGLNYDFQRFSQRNEGALALAQPYLDGEKLIYEAPGLEELEIDPSQFELPEGERVKVKMFPDGGVYDGVLENGPITAWVREMLGKNRKADKYQVEDIDVLLSPPDFARDVEPIHARGEDFAFTNYSDGGQVLTASKSTLDWVNRGLVKEYGPGFREIGMRAFRPNIVIDGLPPNAEDLIDRILIRGRVEMLFGGLSVRCDVTRVDEDSGEKPDKEPLKWLARHRPRREAGKAKRPTFAVNTVFPRRSIGEIISVRDRVLVVG